MDGYTVWVKVNGKPIPYAFVLSKEAAVTKCRALVHDKSIEAVKITEGNQMPKKAKKR